MNTPNLFNFATGELSQDAFLSWIAEWADEKYAVHDLALNSVAKEFLTLFCHHQIEASQIKSVSSYQQYKKIDVLIDIELFQENQNNHLVLIEDKTGAGQHGEQLDKYKNEISKDLKVDGKFENRELHLIYYKTEDHITHEISGYTNISRVDVLKIFESPQASLIKNQIFVDYAMRLRKLENESNAYIRLPTKEWEFSAWKGFFMALCNHLGNDAGFGYVANPQGGFFGAWFGCAPYQGMKDGDSLYLQIGGKREKEPYFNLKVRIASASKERTVELKSYILPLIIEKLESNLVQFSSKNIRKGKTMALVSFDGLEIYNTPNKVEEFASVIKSLALAIKP